MLINGVCTPPTEPPAVCEDPDANNYNEPLPCTYDPEECVAPNVLINGVCTPPTEEPTETPVVPTPVVTATPPTKTPLDVPTCEEMSDMNPTEFLRWTERWKRLDCPAKGYQTGSGFDFNPAPWMIGFGTLLIIFAFLPYKKSEEDAPLM